MKSFAHMRRKEQIEDFKREGRNPFYFIGSHFRHQTALLLPTKLTKP